MRAALVERLVTLATPEIANRILDEALARAGRPFVPEGGIGLESYVRGALRDVTERVLGDDSADALMDDLAPLLRAAAFLGDESDDSQLRLTARPAPMPPAMPTPLAPAPLDAFDAPEARYSSIPVELELPGAGEFEEASGLHAVLRRSLRVVVASRSELRVQAIASELGSSYEVQRVEDVFDLVDVASADASASVVVVVDSTSSAVRPTTLAAASAELPSETQVVLWGASSDESDELEAVAPESGEWMKIGAQATPAQLATYLRSALRRG